MRFIGKSASRCKELSSRCKLSALVPSKLVRPTDYPEILGRV